MHFVGCDQDPCMNGGTCTVNGELTCTCTNGYVGARCQIGELDYGFVPFEEVCQL